MTSIDQQCVIAGSIAAAITTPDDVSAFFYSSGLSKEAFVQSHGLTFDPNTFDLDLRVIYSTVVARSIRAMILHSADQ